MLEPDVLIIGSGAGGGPMALSLAKAGYEVLVLEKGARHSRAAYAHDETEVTRNSFFTPPLEREPHTVVTSQTEQAQLSQLGWIACCVGGGTVHMGAYLYRFHPDDFRMRSRFGDYEELVDWPYDYAALEPYYCLAEREVGVSGLAGANPFEGERSSSYPLPPLDAHPFSSLLEGAIRQRGWSPFPTPRAVASRPYLGRPACAYCEVCAGYGCTVGAKGSTQEALIPRAEATGRCRVVPKAMVFEVTSDSDGLATGCRFRDSNGEVGEVRAPVVCVSCSAVESARLLLLSATEKHPRGLGNGSGLVGRHLQFHAVSMGEASIPRSSLPAKVRRSRHPFLGRSMMDHYFLPDGVSDLAKGGVLRFFLTPERPLLSAERLAFSGESLVWGRELESQVTARLENFLHVGFEVFHDYIPNRGTFVELDAGVRDCWDLPVARIHLDLPQHHEKCGRWVMDRAFEVLRDLGAESYRIDSVGGTSSYLVHGTCRAGSDPKTSVLDPWCRSHEVPNLFVVDGSFMPTSGGASPTLTILANSFRVADHLIAEGMPGK
ncbi:MAG: GMC family oxidoreductase [Acidobacteriota bacterium]